MDNSKCLICLDVKANYFCSGCKHSSGVCENCYWDLQDDQHGSCQTWDACKCLICKKEMNYAAFVANWNDNITGAHGWDAFHGDFKISDAKKTKLLDMLERNMMDWEQPQKPAHPDHLHLDLIASLMAEKM